MQIIQNYGSPYCCQLSDSFLKFYTILYNTTCELGVIALTSPLKLFQAIMSAGAALPVRMLLIRFLISIDVSVVSVREVVGK